MDTISRRALFTTGALAALEVANVNAQQTIQVDQFDSVVTNAASGLYILKNKEQDYSLKIVSGDGTKNVTVVRYAGRTAESDIQLVYQNLYSLLRILRLDV